MWQAIFPDFARPNRWVILFHVSLETVCPPSNIRPSRWMTRNYRMFDSKSIPLSGETWICQVTRERSKKMIQGQANSYFYRQISLLCCGIRLDILQSCHYTLSFPRVLLSFYHFQPFLHSVQSIFSCASCHPTLQTFSFLLSTTPPTSPSVLCSLSWY